MRRLRNERRRLGRRKRHCKQLSKQAIKRHRGTKNVRAALVGAHAAAAAGLVEVDKVHLDALHVLRLVAADVLGDARARGLAARLVAQAHVQVLLHVERVLRVLSQGVNE